MEFLSPRDRPNHWLRKLLICRSPTNPELPNYSGVGVGKKCPGRGPLGHLITDPKAANSAEHLFTTSNHYFSAFHLSQALFVNNYSISGPFGLDTSGD
ncbi:hypothetical protein J6590_059502 [Homalodisca vitripennis]|nr:hypothetical protein J6590_059502 [Homalodisca vitripennis]